VVAGKNWKNKKTIYLLFFCQAQPHWQSDFGVLNCGEDCSVLPLGVGVGNWRVETFAKALGPKNRQALRKKKRLTMPFWHLRMQILLSAPNPQ
jgi:hypothetical protein